MTGNVITVYVGAVGDADLPTCYMAGSKRNIPTILWPGSDQTARCEVALGNHPDPAGYLAEFAQRLLVLADAAAGVRAVGAGGGVVKGHTHEKCDETLCLVCGCCQHCPSKDWQCARCPGCTDENCGCVLFRSAS